MALQPDTDSPKPARIALLTDGIWPYVLGGMQKHSYYLCKYLARNKIHIDLFHFNQSSYNIDSLEFFSEEERKYIRSIVIDFPKSLPFPGHYIYNSYRYSRMVSNAVLKNIKAYDFIYSKGFTGWHLINLKHSGKIKCAPIGVKFHGYEMFQRAPDFKTRLQHILILRRPVKNITKKADLVFSYGGGITDLIRSLGVPDNRIFELPSGIEREMLAENFSPVKEKISFLFLGRYERRKGIEELNVSISDLLNNEKSLSADFHFIGPVPNHLHISHPQVIYHGEIRDREKLKLLVRSCDILICPSWSEGMPNVILEAMGNGLAVLATDVGATNVLVSKKTGWLLDRPDPASIGKIIKKIIDADREEINSRKKNALHLIKKDFIWEELVKRLIRRIVV
jgi:glycosyltransferase involved in cell wall biosynthesis